LAVNVLDLAATRQLDGTAAPWRGARTMRAEMKLSGGNVTVSGTEELSTADDAMAARDWMRNLIASIETALPADVAGQLSVRDVLQRTRIEQSGAEVKFGFRLGASLLWGHTSQAVY
jgi:hypothetical protein